MGGGFSLPNGAPFDILNLKVGEKGADVLPLPAQLSNIARHRAEDAVNLNNPRSFTLAMQGMTHTINGSVFEMDSVARNEIVHLGDLEIWEFGDLEISETRSFSNIRSARTMLRKQPFGRVRPTSRPQAAARASSRRRK